MALGIPVSCERFPWRVHWESLISPVLVGFGWRESDNSMHSVIEMRKAKRYRLSAPAHFLWAPQGGKPQSGRGITRDINASGVYVLADELPPMGALVQLDILVPKLEDHGFGMSLSGEGVVLRIEPHGSRGAGTSKAGFAASVQFYPEASASDLSRQETSG
jgi:hypothetical protein